MNYSPFNLIKYQKLLAIIIFISIDIINSLNFITTSINFSEATLLTDWSLCIQMPQAYQSIISLLTPTWKNLL